MSRMSLINCSRITDEFWMRSRCWRCSAFSSVMPMSSSVPSTPYSGVRISWLMVARKVDFASLALSASRLACARARSISARALMSANAHSTTSCFL
ncbi:hypothetical protein D3C78_1623570 [compost metagenome]